MLKYTWTCSCCGRQEDTLPLDWNFTAPLDYLSVPESERPVRTKLASNFCRVDEQEFVRGIIDIPVIGLDDTLRFGVWVSLSEASAQTVHEVWHDPDCSRHGPFFGWLRSQVKPYPDTRNLKTNVHLRDDRVPFIELEKTDHPLSLEQHHGITVARLIQITEQLLPRH